MQVVGIKDRAFEREELGNELHLALKYNRASCLVPYPRYLDLSSQLGCILPRVLR
jgi:hypothetical protein